MLLAVRGADDPKIALLIASRRGDGCIELYVVPQFQMVGYSIQVFFNFSLLRVSLLPSPFEVNFVDETEDVDPAFTVCACARIAVPIPSLSNVSNTFQISESNDLLLLSHRQLQRPGPAALACVLHTEIEYR